EETHKNPLKCYGIWDHAPGSLIVVEASGIITNMDNEPLNFTLGRHLGKVNKGFVIAHAKIHRQVLEAVQKSSLGWIKRTIGPIYTYPSTDSTDSADDRNINYSHLYPPEFLRSLKIS
ncbi:12939_t:CDS:2, partial [Dentiscutata heterogama]